MIKESICVRVPKIHGERAIILANRLHIVNKELAIKRDEEFIYIPLVRLLSRNELEVFREQVPDCELSTYLLPEREKRMATLVELLKDNIPTHLLASLPHAIDFVGELAIIEVPHELNSYKKEIGEAILKRHRNVRTVLAKAGAVSGTYRLREFNIIAGETKTETVHKEHGCRYYVDLAKAYFSPRLSHEHNRIASLVKEGESVIDLFAGVGPFSILIAKRIDKVKVYAIDANPHAVEFLKKNIRLNRVENKVHASLGDARKTVRQKLSGVADRVIMNLPEKAMEFVDISCEAMKQKGGMMHFYSFADASNTIEDLKRCFIDRVEETGRKVEKVRFSKSVRAIAPYKWQVVLDTEIH